MVWDPETPCLYRSPSLSLDPSIAAASSSTQGYSPNLLICFSSISHSCSFAHPISIFFSLWFFGCFLNGLPMCFFCPGVFFFCEIIRLGFCMIWLDLCPTGVWRSSIVVRFRFGLFFALNFRVFRVVYRCSSDEDWMKNQVKNHFFFCPRILHLILWVWVFGHEWKSSMDYVILLCCSC